MRLQLSLCLTFFFTRQGHIYSYDVRADHSQQAMSNLAAAHLTDYVTLQQRDVSHDGFDQVCRIFFSFLSILSCRRDRNLSLIIGVWSYFLF